ncbi:MAG: DUF1385 domain-containing protein [Oscillospiraceae bacterium]|nr:DUF1385 domain-containing protein [Oscillospiraceae bacterium]
MPNKNKQQQHMTSIGGSAIMEGVMMRGPKDIASAVRTPSGEIVVDKRPISSLVTKYHVNKIPVLRGVFAFFDSLICSMRALMWSAEFFDLEDDSGEEPSKFDKWLTEKLGDKLKDYVIYFSVFISVIFSVGLFFVLPNLVTGFLHRFIEANVLMTLIEGIIRIALFLGYILLVSRMEEIKRVFQYHGAEHKTIFCYEAGLELTPENARKMSRLHPRCGTSFLVFVMIISIIMFSFISWDNMLVRICLRLLLLPVVAGLSYEVIRWAGRSQNRVVCLISKPGMLLQRITTREPDDAQLEVAIASMKAVLTGNKEDDKW